MTIFPCVIFLYAVDGTLQKKRNIMFVIFLAFAIIAEMTSHLDTFSVIIHKFLSSPAILMQLYEE